MPSRDNSQSMPPSLLTRGRHHDFHDGPLIMGIVNINDDSFSRDGRIDPAWALRRAVQLREEGAHIIDIGAESARTNRPAISEDEEIGRLLPVVGHFVRTFGGHSNPPLLSINTWRPAVAEAVLPSGGDILNDMGGLPDDRNARLCSVHGAALLIMHTIGMPKVSHAHVSYPDVMETLDTFFEEKIALACAAGLSRSALILDPGIDFAKQVADNLTIYGHLARLHRFNLPILLPISRKSVIGGVLGIRDPVERDHGTAACLVSGMLRGAAIFRVHNVVMARQTIATVKAVMGGSRWMKANC